MPMTTFLEIGLLNADSSVMRLLPPEIAYRYQALPVAADGDYITVAMAEPEDQQASKAIQELIDHPICFIHADPGLIENQLHHLWPTSAPHPRLLSWFPEKDDLLESYTRYLAELMDAALEGSKLPANESGSLKELRGIIQEHQPDLLVFQASHPSRVMRSILRETSDREVPQPSSYLAVPPRPIWPIKKILLVLPDSTTGSDLAVGWTEKLARPGKIEVTVLPVLPPVPLCYGSFLHHNLDGILTGTDQLGVKMRQIANRFTGENIQGVYKLREGDPVTQIRDEIYASQPDLIIMPSCLKGGCKTWLNADLPSMLFKTLTTPMLLTSEN